VRWGIAAVCWRRVECVGPPRAGWNEQIDNAGRACASRWRIWAGAPDWRGCRAALFMVCLGGGRRPSTQAERLSCATTWSRSGGAASSPLHRVNPAAKVFPLAVVPVCSSDAIASLPPLLGFGSGHLLLRAGDRRGAAAVGRERMRRAAWFLCRSADLRVNRRGGIAGEIPLEVAGAGLKG